MQPAASGIDRRLGIGLALIGTMLMIAPCGESRAQDESVTDYQAWTDLATITNFSEVFRYDGDYGYRTSFETDLEGIFIRPSVRFLARPWLTLHGGIGWFHTFNRGGPDLAELRPWVGVRATWPKPGGFKFTHYFRAELRTFTFTDGSPAPESRVRLRYQLAVKTPAFRLAGAEGFTGLASIEPFRVIEESFEVYYANRVRIDVGIGKVISARLRTELHYLFHTGRIGGEFDLDVREHTFRLRFFYAFN